MTKITRHNAKSGHIIVYTLEEILFSATLRLNQYQSALQEYEEYFAKTKSQVVGECIPAIKEMIIKERKHIETLKRE